MRWGFQAGHVEIDVDNRKQFFPDRTGRDGTAHDFGIFRDTGRDWHGPDRE
jgi:hypothetical protein